MIKPVSYVEISIRGFTLRVIDPDERVGRDVVHAVKDAISKAYDSLKLPPHLFVSIVAGEVISDESGAGFGVYLQGAQCILIAGLMPDSWPGTHAEWLLDVRTSVVHECVHYLQDVQGTLDGSDENEREAERLCMEIAW